MHSIRYLGVGLLFLLGCQAMPTVTRTGDVKDLIIGDDLAAAETFVNAGDEVRWVNKRTAPVRLVFLDPVSDKQLSCKNHIGGWMTPNDTARLATNETASACFRDAGQFRYTVRMDSALTTGEINVPGVIQVEGKAVRRWIKRTIKEPADRVGTLAFETARNPSIDRVVRRALRRRRRPRQQCPRGNGARFVGARRDGDAASQIGRNVIDLRRGNINISWKISHDI